MDAFTKFAVFLLALPFNMLLRGFVLTKLWGWFVVTTFSAPSLPLTAALGVSCLLSFAHGMPDPNRAEKPESEQTGPVGILLLSAAHALLILGIGWIVSLFM